MYEMVHCKHPIEVILECCHNSIKEAMWTQFHSKGIYSFLIKAQYSDTKPQSFLPLSYPQCFTSNHFTKFQHLVQALYSNCPIFISNSLMTTSSLLCNTRAAA